MTGALPTADQVDRVVLRECAEVLGAAVDGDLLVLEDPTGALVAEALRALEGSGRAVLLWTASHAHAAEACGRHRREIAAGALLVAGAAAGVPMEPVDLAAFLEGREVHGAIGRLPLSLRALEHRSAALAHGLSSGRTSGGRVVLGGRVKHMTRRQNEVLARHFGEAGATRGLGTSRALWAQGPRPSVPAAGEQGAGSVRIPVRGAERDLVLHARGGVFAGASADAGGLLLLRALDREIAAGRGPVPRGSDPGAALGAVDLGCGNGLLGAHLRLAMPAVRLAATDEDADAVLSARATLAANEPEAAAGSAGVTWDSSASRLPDASADVVLLNPPFHQGGAIDATLVQGLLDASARLLRPGGELWFVHNSHLRHRTEVERRVGPARQMERDRRFTVLRATRR